MAIHFGCPICGAALKAPDGSEGKRGRCKNCDSSVAIPIAVQVEASSHAGPQQSGPIVDDGEFPDVYFGGLDDPQPEPTHTAIESPEYPESSVSPVMAEERSVRRPRRSSVVFYLSLSALFAGAVIAGYGYSISQTLVLVPGLVLLAAGALPLVVVAVRSIPQPPPKNTRPRRAVFMICLALACPGALGLAYSLMFWSSTDHQQRIWLMFASASALAVCLALVIWLKASSFRVSRAKGAATRSRPSEGGLFRKEDYAYFVLGLFLVGGLAAIPLTYGIVTGIEYVESLPYAFLSCLVFFVSLRRNGTFALVRFVMAMVAATVAGEVYSQTAGKPGFVAGGILGFLLLLLSGYCGVGVARLLGR